MVVWSNEDETGWDSISRQSAWQVAPIRVARRVWMPVLFALCCAGASGQTPGGTLPGQTGPGGAPASGSGRPEAKSVPQAANEVAPAAAEQDTAGPVLPALRNNLIEFQGLRVEAIRYAGVDFDKTDKLTAELSQKAGEPLDPNKVRQMTRRLFQTGRYTDIAVRVERQGSGVILIFAGTPQYYVGRVEIDGVKEDRLASLLEYGSKLEPGTPFSDAQVPAGTAAIQAVLAQNGYYQPLVVPRTVRDEAGQQVNVFYNVIVGPQARVGNVTIVGNDPGVTETQFRKKGKLKRKSRVTRDTTSTALSNVREIYQKKNRLEAVATLNKSTYDLATKTLNYEFHADQGPTVKVEVEGAKIAVSRLHLLVPIFQEGAVDNDLMNEGSHNIREFLEQQGYFDATVQVRLIGQGTASETVLYTVDRGVQHKVLSVAVRGSKYFTEDLLKDRLRVQKADAYLRSGRYSQALVSSDEASIEGLYRANGFSNVKVTSAVKDIDEAKGKRLKQSEIAVTYTVDEGMQQRFGAVNLGGVDAARQQTVKSLLNTQAGQPFSLITLSGDRDAVLAYYLSNGFDQAKVEVQQTVEKQDKTLTDVTMAVTEGPQVFVGKVLLSGERHVRPDLVNDQMKVHAGDPLDQSALLETQRNLYNLALFNEVIATVQNPTGDAEQKNAIVQLTEAKRWNVTYGFGFEAQTGTPSLGQYQTAQGTTKAQEGKAGVSPRVSVDVSRIMVRGKDESFTFHGTYGLLEEIATGSFLNPHLRGSRNFSLSLTGGYSNVQNITTFQSSALTADLRVTERAGRKDTFIYDFQYRRIAVNPNSLAIAADLIPILSEPVRVGGPGITWYHDTRSPSQLDAQKGSYTSAQEFLASSKFGSQTAFNRTDLTNSTYYTFGKRKYVLARSTRFGFINSRGPNPNADTPTNPNPSCAGELINTNGSCNPVPLPERLYAGGGSSFRAYPINGAGPRDLQTGFPVGGSAVFVNITELRLPAPVLPYVGSSVSFVVFHDMGNIFQNIGDVFPSFTRYHQPNQSTCEVITGVTIGTCSFNYFTHDIGIGARYNTPVGPVRIDFPITLNPPTYPVIPQIDTTTGTYLNGGPNVGHASRFGFFFSIGQSF